MRDMSDGLLRLALMIASTPRRPTTNPVANAPTGVACQATTSIAIARTTKNTPNAAVKIRRDVARGIAATSSNSACVTCESYVGSMRGTLVLALLLTVTRSTAGGRAVGEA